MGLPWNATSGLIARDLPCVRGQSEWLLEGILCKRVESLQAGSKRWSFYSESIFLKTPCWEKEKRPSQSRPSMEPSVSKNLGLLKPDNQKVVFIWEESERRSERMRSSERPRLLGGSQVLSAKQEAAPHSSCPSIQLCSRRKVRL